MSGGHASIIPGTGRAVFQNASECDGFGLFSPILSGLRRILDHTLGGPPLSPETQTHFGPHAWRASVVTRDSDAFWTSVSWERWGLPGGWASPMPLRLGRRRHYAP